MFFIFSSRTRDDVLDIEVGKPWFFFSKELLEESEAKVERISTEDLPVVFQYNGGLGMSEIDEGIWIIVFIGFLDRLWEGDDRWDDRDDVFSESTPDILERSGTREGHEYIYKSELYVFSDETDRIGDSLSIDHDRGDRGGDELHLGVRDADPRLTAGSYALEGFVFHFFDDRVDLLHADRYRLILSDIVHADRIIEHMRGRDRYDHILGDILDMLSCLGDRLLDRFRDAV